MAKSARAPTSPTRSSAIGQFKLFIDLDGVLVDFERGVREATGKAVDEQSPRAMWATLARTPGFYANLSWLPDGRQLWQAVGAHAPTILSGLPFGRWAEPQKRAWCERELGAAVQVITCMTRQKPDRAREATPDGVVPVIVDDRDSIRERWEAVGGVFVHHKSAAESIAELRRLGVICARAI